jgi:hypothetical protein
MALQTLRQLNKKDLSYMVKLKAIPQYDTGQGADTQTIVAIQSLGNQEVEWFATDIFSADARAIYMSKGNGGSIWRRQYFSS